MIIPFANQSFHFTIFNRLNHSWQLSYISNITGDSVKNLSPVLLANQTLSFNLQGWTLNATSGAIVYASPQDDVEFRLLFGKDSITESSFARFNISGLALDNYQVKSRCKAGENDNVCSTELPWMSDCAPLSAYHTCFEYEIISGGYRFDCNFYMQNNLDTQMDYLDQDARYGSFWVDPPTTILPGTSGYAQLTTGPDWTTLGEVRYTIHDGTIFRFHCYDPSSQDDANNAQIEATKGKDYLYILSFNCLSGDGGMPPSQNPNNACPRYGHPVRVTYNVDRIKSFDECQFGYRFPCDTDIDYDIKCLRVYIIYKTILPVAIDSPTTNERMRIKREFDRLSLLGLDDKNQDFQSGCTYAESALINDKGVAGVFIDTTLRVGSGGGEMGNVKFNLLLDWRDRNYGDGNIFNISSRHDYTSLAGEGFTLCPYGTVDLNTQLPPTADIKNCRSIKPGDAAKVRDDFKSYDFFFLFIQTSPHFLTDLSAWQSFAPNIRSYTDILVVKKDPAPPICTFNSMSWVLGFQNGYIWLQYPQYQRELVKFFSNLAQQKYVQSCCDRGCTTPGGGYKTSFYMSETKSSFSAVDAYYKADRSGGSVLSHLSIDTNKMSDPIKLLFPSLQILKIQLPQLSNLWSSKFTRSASLIPGGVLVFHSRMALETAIFPGDYAIGTAQKYFTIQFPPSTSSSSLYKDQDDVSISPASRKYIKLTTSTIDSRIKKKFELCYRLWLETCTQELKDKKHFPHLSACLDSSEANDLLSLDRSVIPLYINKLSYPENFIALIPYHKFQNAALLPNSNTVDVRTALESVRLWLKYMRTGNLPQTTQQHCANTKSTTYLLSVPLVHQIPCTQSIHFLQNGAFVVPLLVLASQDIENSKVCKLHFNATTSRSLSTITQFGPKPFFATECRDITLLSYGDSGFESQNFKMRTNSTGVQIKAISFNLTDLYTPSNTGVSCTSFAGTSTPRYDNTLVEQAMLENLKLASNGTYYILDRAVTADSSLLLYQNDSDIYAASNENGVPSTLVSLADLCQPHVCEIVCLSDSESVDMLGIANQ